MKKICSILLSIILGICALFTLLLSIVRVDLSYSALTKIAGEILKPVAKLEVPADGLFHPEDKIISLAQYDEYGDFDFSSIDLSSMDLTNLDVNEIVQTYLDAAGVDVDPAMISEMLASDEVSEFVDKYAGEIVNYMTGASEELTIDPEDFKKVMNKSLDMYEEYTGEAVDRTGLDEAIETNIEVAKAQITEALDTAKEDNAEIFDLLKKVEFFLSLKFFLICVGVCLLLALFLFLINRNIFTWLLYTFIPLFVDGILIFVAACTAQGVVPGLLKLALSDLGLPKGVYEGIWSYIVIVLKHLKICGAVTAIVSTVLWATGIALGKKAKPAA